MCALQAVAGLGPRRPRRAYGLAMCALQAVAGLGPRRPRRAYGLRKRIVPKTDSADETVSSESIAIEMNPGLSGWAP
jgi:hypothetical protein